MSQIMATNLSESEDRRNLTRFEVWLNLCPIELESHLFSPLKQRQPIDAFVSIESNPQLEPLDDRSVGPSAPPPYSAIPGTVPLYMGRTAGPPPSYDDVINPEGIGLIAI